MTDIQSRMVEFGGDGGQGFLASPSGDGPFPGVIVVQEWWGLDAHIKDVAGRFAAEGFVALAPDLYHGKVAGEPDEAQKLMMSLDMNNASRELIKATEYLASQPSVAGRGIGTTGFCMGGGLALTLAPLAAGAVSFPFWPSQATPLLSCGITGRTPCTNLCQLISTFQNFVYFGLTFLLFAIAPVLIAWGGIQILIAGGSPSARR